MTTLNISLPDSQRKFIEAQVTQQGYSTASEYIRNLIRQDQEKVKQKRIETLLLEGLDSGEFVEVNDEWWEQKRTELVQHLRQQKS